MTGRSYSPTDLNHPLIRRLGKSVWYSLDGQRRRGTLANVTEDGRVTIERNGFVEAVVRVDDVEGWK